MPIHDYKCKKCGFQDEYNSSFSVAEDSKPPDKCPKCGGELEKLFSATGQSFDVIGGTEYHYGGKRNWKSRLSQEDQAKVLTGEKDPY